MIDNYIGIVLLAPLPAKSFSNHRSYSGRKWAHFAILRVLTAGKRAAGKMNEGDRRRRRQMLTE